jgi:hypothetical protein
VSDHSSDDSVPVRVHMDLDSAQAASDDASTASAASAASSNQKKWMENPRTRPVPTQSDPGHKKKNVQQDWKKIIVEGKV